MSPTLSAPAIILFTSGGAQLPEGVQSWLDDQLSQRLEVTSGDELMAIALIGRP